MGSRGHLFDLPVPRRIHQQPSNDAQRFAAERVGDPPSRRIQDAGSLSAGDSNQQSSRGLEAAVAVELKPADPGLFEKHPCARANPEAPDHQWLPRWAAEPIPSKGTYGSGYPLPFELQSERPGPALVWRREKQRPVPRPSGQDHHDLPSGALVEQSPQLVSQRPPEGDRVINQGPQFNHAG